MNRLACAVIFLLMTAEAQAMEFSGPGIGLTEIADQALTEVETFGLSIAGIGIILLGLGVALGVSIERMGHPLVAGSILAGGAIFASTVLGATP
jgi:hypothetical protein